MTYRMWRCITSNHVGERLSALVGFERLKLAAAAVLLAPYVPMLFMGEDYGEKAPLLYFVSHSDEELIRKVQEGCRKEFAGFKWQQDPPDPQNPQTFETSRLHWKLRNGGDTRLLLAWHIELLKCAAKSLSCSSLRSIMRGYRY